MERTVSASGRLEEVNNSSIGKLQSRENETLHRRMKNRDELPLVTIVDYKPSLKKAFAILTRPWLSTVVDGKLEEEDLFTLRYPDKAYIKNGGFVFFAILNEQPVGCVALKRLSDDSYEFCKLFVDPAIRKAGLATQLIERCITRCKENYASVLWLQTTGEAVDAHRLYYKLGFEDDRRPKEMDILHRTTKVMRLFL